MKTMIVSAAALTLLNVPVAAQIPDSFERWDSAVVRIKCDAGRTGTGVIVEKAVEGIIVVTAGHVLEGSPAPSPCEVLFRDEPRWFRAVWLDADVKATGVDLAVLRVLVPADLTAAAQVQPLREADPEDLWVLAPVFTIGHPLGQQWVWNQTSVSATDSSRTRVAVARGTAAAGSSGGPVFTPAGGLVGLATAVTPTLLELTTVPDIRERLKLVGVNAKLLTTDVAPSKSPLKFGPLPASGRLEASTRDVLRRYHQAMLARDLEALLRIRADLGRPALTALLADSAEITMPMSCQPLNRSSLTMTCEYSLEIISRTGSKFEKKGLKQMFVFGESGDGTWRIIKADVPK